MASDTVNTPSSLSAWATSRQWLGTFGAMLKKELILLTRYPVEFVASFGQVFVIVTVLTLAGLMFAPGGVSARNNNGQTAGLVIYGFILFMFVTNTLWGMGFDMRREQKQGTLEQLYLSPASKLASLTARVVMTVLWTGLVCVLAAGLMSALIGRLPFNNLALGLYLLAMGLAGTFGIGFAFAALTLRIKDTAQTLTNALQFAFMVFCAPFFPFSALPAPLQAVAHVIPTAYVVDAFRATLMGFPAGFPELAPIGVEIGIVSAFGVLMPLWGLRLYRQAEDRARQDGTLSEY